MGLVHPDLVTSTVLRVKQLAAPWLKCYGVKHLLSPLSLLCVDLLEDSAESM